MNKSAIILLVLFSFWVTRDLFRPDFFRSHDGLYHVIRLDQFRKSFIAGQIPVRWAPDLLSGLGYPLFVVNYHLPYYLAEAFHLLGLSLFAAIKAVFIVSLTASALTSFWLFYSWTKNHLAATLGAIFFILAPYRLANIFERAALGEALAYAFVPLLFLGLDYIRSHRSPHLFTFALAATSLSHTVILLAFLPAILFYWLFHRPLRIKLVFISLIFSFGLTAFQIFPVLFERQYLKFDANLLTAYQGHFKSLYQLLRFPAPGINIGTRFQVGLAHTLVILMAFISFKKYWFWLIVALASIFLITPASQFLWANLPVLPMVLYPWRFLGVVAFATAALVALLRPKFFVSGILFLIILYSTRHYTKVDQFIPAIFPRELLAGNGTTQNEFDPIWFKPEILTQPLDPSAKLYFPGWPGSPDAAGLIYGQNLTWQETPIRTLGNWLSLITFGLWLATLLKLPHVFLRHLPHS